MATFFTRRPRRLVARLRAGRQTRLRCQRHLYDGARTRQDAAPPVWQQGRPVWSHDAAQRNSLPRVSPQRVFLQLQR